MKIWGEDGHLCAKVRGLRRKQTCQHLELKTSTLQYCEKINFCHLRHSVGGTLLWPKQTDTRA